MTLYQTKRHEAAHAIVCDVLIGANLILEIGIQQPPSGPGGDNYVRRGLTKSSTDAVELIYLLAGCVAEALCGHKRGSYEAAGDDLLQVKNLCNTTDDAVDALNDTILIVQGLWPRIEALALQLPDSDVWDEQECEAEILQARNLPAKIMAPLWPMPVEMEKWFREFYDNL